jgi:predicted RNA binding protein YcfA (HicA-like mRNA interferase family)
MSKSVSSNKEVKNVVRLAVKAGWRIEKTNGGHVLLYPPNKEDGFVTMPTSPSSYRNFKNVLMMLRAKGLDV